MSGAPVHILGWDEERQVWLARRDGEPSFVWVQDFDDAHQAAISPAPGRQKLPAPLPRPQHASQARRYWLVRLSPVQAADGSHAAHSHSGSWVDVKARAECTGCNGGWTRQIEESVSVILPKLTVEGGILQ